MEAAETQKIVTDIHFGSVHRKFLAISRLGSICRANPGVQKTLAELGVVPRLLDFLDSPENAHRISAIQALIGLSQGNYRNKALIAESGGVQKIANALESKDGEIKEMAAMALLSLSVHENNRTLMASTSGLLTQLVKLLDHDDGQARAAVLGVFQNLSACIECINGLAKEQGLTEALMNLIATVQEETATERALATLVNLTVTETGRNRILNFVGMPGNLIQVLVSENFSEKCKERSSYILLLLAGKGSEERAKMVDAGIVPALLDVGLSSKSAAARRRCLRIFKMIKADSDKIRSSSGSEYDSSSELEEMVKQKEAVRLLVERSLQFSMSTIISRAASS